MRFTHAIVLSLLAAGAVLPPASALTRQQDQPRNQAGAAPRTIEVIVRRFAFEPAVIEATEGERLRVLVRSADGPHGFEIKKFKVSKEVPRGTEPVVIEFTPDEAGRYPILCSLFCGDGHADMKGTLVVAARAAAGD
jgi:cytochrome c oxidase subunit 2